MIEDATQIFNEKLLVLPNHSLTSSDISLTRRCFYSLIAPSVVRKCSLSRGGVFIHSPGGVPLSSSGVLLFQAAVFLCRVVASVAVSRMC